MVKENKDTAQKQKLVNFWAFSSNGDISKVNPDFCSTLKDVRQFLKGEFNGGYNSQLNNLTAKGLYKCLGIVWDFRPFLKTFLADYGDGHFTKYYAPSATALRRVLHLPKYAQVIALNTEVEKGTKKELEAKIEKAITLAKYIRRVGCSRRVYLALTDFLRELNALESWEKAND